MIVELTRDRFLGGRVIADQPKHGFRAGHDTVLLAAAVPAQAGERVLELGSGAGIASLCLAMRVSGVDVTGVEIDPELVHLGNGNAKLNGMAERVHFMEGDVHYLRYPFVPEIRDTLFDRVFLNPPFHQTTGSVSPSVSRDLATRGYHMAVWIWEALQFSRIGGTITAIIRADRLSEVESAANVDAASKGGVSLTMLPLLPHAGEEPKRVIVCIVNGVRAPLRTLPGLVLHESGGRNTEAAEAVLRHGAGLPLA